MLGFQPRIHRRRALQCDQGARTGRIRYRLVGLGLVQRHVKMLIMCSQRGYQQPDGRRSGDQEGYQRLQQEDPGQACAT
jgi:hypothetical protein